jgi:hypothetical protein
MRENRPYGSEGGEGKTLPDPYHKGAPMSARTRGQIFGHCPTPAQHRAAHDGSKQMYVMAGGERCAESLSFRAPA